MKINKRGFWENQTEEGHLFDESLCLALIGFMKGRNVTSVVDFGCGPGKYLKHFKNHFEAKGYDGNPYTEKLTNGLASVLDLSIKVRLGRDFDTVVCLEVGEHIPRKYEEIFMDNLMHHTKTYLIISWAVKGQRGDGHINCRSNSYIKTAITDYGFENLEKEEGHLKKMVSDQCPWFRDTLMIFKKLNNNEIDNIYQKIAHFLLINSDGISTNAAPSKMNILHFFFRYAQRYENQHYADFAFELLQENLSQVISDIQRYGNGGLDVIEIGHGIIRFVNNGFFESEELDDILLPFDEIAIHETQRLSRDEFSHSNIHGLLTVVSYFLDRMAHLDEMAGAYFVIKEHLLIALFELVHHIKVWSRRDISGIILMELLLKKCKTFKETTYLAKKGLRLLETNILYENEPALGRYRLGHIDWDLNQVLLLSLYFSEKKKNIFKNKEQLQKTIETQIAHNMERQKDDPSTLNIQRVIVYALILLEGPKSKDILFQVHTLIKLINQK